MMSASGKSPVSSDKQGEATMRNHLFKRAATATIGAIVLTSAAFAANAGAAVPEEPPDCYPPVIDPVSRLYVELEIVEIPGAVFGPPRPTCETPPEPVMPL
jgi:hypothetical protein